MSDTTHVSAIKKTAIKKPLIKLNINKISPYFIKWRNFIFNYYIDKRAIHYIQEDYHPI